MLRNKNLLNRLLERTEDLDVKSMQALIRQLTRERGMMETVFNAVDEGILVVGRHLEIRYFNNAAKELLQLPEDSGSVRLSQFFPDIDWATVLQLGEENWTRLSRQEIEISYPVRRILQFCLVPESDAGFATVILRDVTEARRKALNELETETAQMVAMLAGNVAHEIGNPLNSIYLNLQLLSRELQGSGADDETVEMLSACMTEVGRLDNIIHQFLRAIRPGNTIFEPTDLKQLLLETLTIMRPEIETRHITVHCDFPSLLPPVNADAGQLKQVFFNIIKNATQAMEEDGSLIIRAKVINDGDYLELNFDDDGKGITATQLQHIFDPFKSFRQGGTGLGMMIIERILREHGAELLLDTEPGAGTRLHIRFPLRAKRMRVLGAGDAS